MELLKNSNSALMNLGQTWKRQEITKLVIAGKNPAAPNVRVKLNSMFNVS